MAYLELFEYETQIRGDVLNMIKANKDNVRTFAELAAQQEIESYLNARYDMRVAFLDYNYYSQVGSYTKPQRVVYAKPIILADYPVYLTTETYNKGDLVNYSGTVYECNSTQSVIGAFDENLWNTLTPKPCVYECNSDTAITGAFDATKWDVIFEKYNLLTMYTIDATLYHVFSRVQPQQIPQLRIDRYNAVIKWLEKVSDGEISAHLPLLKNSDDEEENGVIKHGDRGTVSVRGSRYF